MSGSCTITKAGIQALINAEATGTTTVSITKAIFSSKFIEVTTDTKLEDITDIVAELNTVSGLITKEDTIHVSVGDASDATYIVATIGLVTDDGILFAVTSNQFGLLQKVTDTQAYVSFDLIFVQGNPRYITFGDTNFINPNATLKQKGIVQLTNQYGDGEDKAVTPKGLKTLKEYVDKSYYSREHIDENIATLNTDQEIDSVKTFKKLPKSDLLPEDDSELANKDYVDRYLNRLNIFDVVIKDHTLSYGKDLQGYAQLGTWVYKDPVAGSRYGYPDFYQKCLDEFNDPENETEAIYFKKFHQPVLSANGTLGGTAFAVTANGTYSGDYPVWRAVNKLSFSSEGWIGPNGSLTGWYTFYNPTPLYVKKLTIQNRNDGNGIIEYGSVDGSNDNATWEAVAEFTNDSGRAANAIWDIDLSNNDKAYNYYRINVGHANNAWVCITELMITAYEQVINIIKTPNGHRYIDASNQPEVIELYNQVTSPNYYLIDTENERVLLPTNQAHRTLVKSVHENGFWYRFYSDGWCEQGGNNIILLANTSNNIIPLVLPFRDTDYNLVARIDDTDGTNVAGAEWAIGYKTTREFRIGFSGGYSHTQDIDWTASGFLDESSYPTDFVAIPYMIVGDVNSSRTVSTAVDVTTTNNDTVPLFTAHQFDFTPSNLSWLRGGTQTNNSGIYTTCYNELVNVLNGDTRYGNLKVVEKSKMTSGTDYSEYWVVDQDDQTFTTPSRTNERFVIATYQLETDWYRIYSDGWCEQGATEYPGNTVAGTRTAVFFKAFKDTKYNFYFTQKHSGAGSGDFGDEIYTNRTPYSTQFNIIAGFYGYSWVASGYLALSEYQEYLKTFYYKVANSVENQSLINLGEVTEELADKIGRRDCPAYLIETYHKNDGFYRIYSDGFCIQGNTFVPSTSGYQDVYFLVPFRDIHYVMTVGQTSYNSYTGGPGNINQMAVYNGKNKFYDHFQTYAEAGGGNLAKEWVAYGYVKLN